MRCSYFERFVKLVLLLIIGSSVMSAQSGIWGTWKEPGGSTIEVLHCGAEACLRLVFLSPTAPSKVDSHNPNAKLRSRSLCGLEIGTGFHVEGNDAADGGLLYDPKSGKTYKGSVNRVNEELHLRGYIGISLFGRTETWIRTKDRSYCEKMP